MLHLFVAVCACVRVRFVLLVCMSLWHAVLAGMHGNIT